MAIDAAIERGDLFLAYDLANKACEAEPGNPLFRHRAVLALARLKSSRALPLYEEWGLAKIHTGDRILDIDLASLGARLLKDRALAAPADQRRELLAPCGGTLPDRLRVVARLLSGNQCCFPLSLVGRRLTSEDDCRRSAAARAGHGFLFSCQPGGMRPDRRGH